MDRNNLLVQLILAIHAADCSTPENCPGHGNKYTKLGEAALNVLPPDREPWWLTDRKLVQETALELIITRLDKIEKALHTQE